MQAKCGLRIPPSALVNLKDPIFNHCKERMEPAFAMATCILVIWAHIESVTFANNFSSRYFVRSKCHTAWGRNLPYALAWSLIGSCDPPPPSQPKFSCGGRGPGSLSGAHLSYPIPTGLAPGGQLFALLPGTSWSGMENSSRESYEPSVGQVFRKT